VVHVHLGLYGTFTDVPIPMPLPVGQVRMRMIGTEYGTDFARPHGVRGDRGTRGRRCGCQTRAGPAAGATPTAPWPGHESASPADRSALLLMDQTVIAGIGNVYRNELLYRHRIDPYRTGTHIDEAEFDAMWTDLVELMKGRFPSRKDHRGPARGRPRPAVVFACRPRTYVYPPRGVSPAGSVVLRSAPPNWRAANVFWCPTCQK